MDDIETMNVLKLNPLSRLGTPVEIVETFGGKDARPRASARGTIDAWDVSTRFRTT